MLDAEALQVLAEVFPQLSPESLERLGQTAQIRHFLPNTLLGREGDPEGSLFIVLDGVVEIFKTYDDEKTFIGSKGRGEFFGEMSLVLEEPRSADLISVGPVRVIEIRRQAFLESIRTNPEFLLALVQITMQQLRRDRERLDAMIAAHQRERGRGAG